MDFLAALKRAQELGLTKQEFLPIYVKEIQAKTAKISPPSGSEPELSSRCTASPDPGSMPESMQSPQQKWNLQQQYTQNTSAQHGEPNTYELRSSLSHSPGLLHSQFQNFQFETSSQNEKVNGFQQESLNCLREVCSDVKLLKDGLGNNEKLLSELQKTIEEGRIATTQDIQCAVGGVLQELSNQNSGHLGSRMMHSHRQEELFANQGSMIQINHQNLQLQIQQHYSEIAALLRDVTSLTAGVFSKTSEFQNIVCAELQQQKLNQQALLSSASRLCLASSETTDLLHKFNDNRSCFHCQQRLQHPEKTDSDNENENKKKADESGDSLEYSNISLSNFSDENSDVSFSSNMFCSGSMMSLTCIFSIRNMSSVLKSRKELVRVLYEKDLDCCLRAVIAFSDDKGEIDDLDIILDICQVGRDVQLPDLLRVSSEIRLINTHSLMSDLIIARENGVFHLPRIRANGWFEVCAAFFDCKIPQIAEFFQQRDIFIQFRMLILNRLINGIQERKSVTKEHSQHTIHSESGSLNRSINSESGSLNRSMNSESGNHNCYINSESEYLTHSINHENRKLNCPINRKNGSLNSSINSEIGNLNCSSNSESDKEEYFDVEENFEAEDLKSLLSSFNKEEESTNEHCSHHPLITTDAEIIPPLSSPVDSKKLSSLNETSGLKLLLMPEKLNLQTSDEIKELNLQTSLETKDLNTQSPLQAGQKNLLTSLDAEDLNTQKPSEAEDLNQETLENEDLNQDASSETDELNQETTETEELNKETSQIEELNQETEELNQETSENEEVNQETTSETEELNQEISETEELDQETSETEELGQETSQTEEFDQETSQTEELNQETSETGELNNETEELNKKTSETEELDQETSQTEELDQEIEELNQETSETGGLNNETEELNQETSETESLNQGTSETEEFNQETSETDELFPQTLKCEIFNQQASLEDEEMKITQTQRRDDMQSTVNELSKQKHEEKYHKPLLLKKESNQHSVSATDNSIQKLTISNQHTVSKLTESIQQLNFSEESNDLKMSPFNESIQQLTFSEESIQQPVSAEKLHHKQKFNEESNSQPTHSVKESKQQPSVFNLQKSLTAIKLNSSSPQTLEKRSLRKLSSFENLPWLVSSETEECLATLPPHYTYFFPITDLRSHVGSESLIDSPDWYLKFLGHCVHAVLVFLDNDTMMVFLDYFHGKCDEGLPEFALFRCRLTLLDESGKMEDVVIGDRVVEFDMTKEAASDWMENYVGTVSCKDIQGRYLVRDGVLLKFDFYELE